MKFFETSLFRDKTEEDRVDSKMLKLVALYLCRQSSKERTYKVANLITGESNNTQKIYSHKFQQGIKSVLKMAAISFSKAVYETKYMDDLYTELDYN